MSSLGRFQIVQELGRGGMGVVFRAHDPSMARDVALKVLRLDSGLEPAERDEIQQRFEREAKAAGGLNHPNIVTHYECGESGGYKFIVMELVEGRALHKLMSDGPRPDLQTSLSILRQMAAALDYAHGRGVIHRDIKPANVLLPSAGGAKIADFGIAKSNIAGSMTAATTVLGSPHYMSPEQIEGRQITGRSDQWALAVTAYELLAGRKPFDSDSIAALFQQILATQPPDPSQYEPHIPSAARHVFQRALSKSPEQRFETCGEFVEALAQAASATAAPAATRERGSRPNYAAILMGTALVMCAGAFWSFRHFGHPVQAHKALPPQVAAAALPAPDPSLKAGQTRANRRDDLTYVWIAPGVFRMGCSPGDSDCRSDETPHDVTISRGFWLGQTEVPVQAFKHFTLATEAAMPKPPEGDPNWADPSMPISNVSWSSASAYCAWVGGRLPTEAEWEFGARAGSPQPRYGPLDQIAWFASNSKAHAHLVKKFLPNDVGLYDTLGNVWEWTSDFYERDYYAQSPSSDPTGPASGEYRVLRGGSWLRSPSDVRVSLRYPALPNSPDQAVGFRCAAVDMP